MFFKTKKTKPENNYRSTPVNIRLTMEIDVQEGRNKSERERKGRK